MEVDGPDLDAVESTTHARFEREKRFSLRAWELGQIVA